MASMVEATSLQSVIDLASNPPEHPTPNIPSATQPLVLYIARVPGSRDVFLTPIRPREKVVTAEDVQSSLYYVHVSSDEDYGPPPQQQPPPQLRPSSANSNAGQLPSIAERRKKVAPPLPRRRAPATAPYALQTPPYPVSDGVPLIQEQPPTPKTSQHISRKPVLADITNMPPSRAQPAVGLPSLPPRPLPALPGRTNGPPVDETSLYADNLRLLRSSSHLDEHQNPYSRNFTTHPETLKQQAQEHTEALRKLELEARPEVGSLTLIRRDPGSSSQWNVASVYDPPVHEVSSSSFLVPSAKQRTKKGGTPVYLDITNPGYAKFIDEQRPSSQPRPSTSSASSTSSDPPPEGTFRRRLYMPGSRYAEHNYASTPLGHQRAHSSLSAASGESAPRQTMRSERHSVDMGVVTADRRSKGYTFVSPWDGTCEFSTGATGRNLKCRHRVGHAVEEVSELRFNLPTSSKGGGGKVKTNSYFSRHRFANDAAGDDEDDFESGTRSPTIMLTEDGRIDLSLGQEWAGGGFGGKQAKLGKLVILPQGVKMLDLLVAANVGLWWRAWERV